MKTNIRYPGGTISGVPNFNAENREYVEHSNVTTNRITAIFRIGNPRQWTVTLGCGHRYTIDNAALADKQLFVGKGGQTCATCAEVAATAQRRRRSSR